MFRGRYFKNKSINLVFCGERSERVSYSLAQLVAPFLRTCAYIEKSVYPSKIFSQMNFCRLFFCHNSVQITSLEFTDISDIGISRNNFSINLSQLLRFRISGNLDSRFDQIKSRLSIQQIECCPLRHGLWFVYKSLNTKTRIDLIYLAFVRCYLLRSLMAMTFWNHY